MDTAPTDRPDPGSATTPAEFLRALRQLRAWAGQPSLRALNALGGTAPVPGRPPADILPVSTLSDNLAGKRLPNLPRLSFVSAFVSACLRAGGHHDGDEIAAETHQWSHAWQALTATEPAQPLATAAAIADAPDTPPADTTEPAASASPKDASPSVAPPPARHASRRRWPGHRQAAMVLPALTGLLGAAAGAATVWLAMPPTSPSATPPGQPLKATPSSSTSDPKTANPPAPRKRPQSHP